MKRREYSYATESRECH